MSARPSSRRNVVFSAAERGLLTLLSIVTSPLIVHGFGETRYGILSIGLTTVGFLAFLDLGVTAAAVRELAQSHGAGDQAAARRVFSTALGIYVGLALLAGGTLFLAAPWLVGSVFTIAPADMPDAVFVLRMSGVGLGLNLLLAPLTAVPRALQRLDISTGISIALTVASTLGLVVAARADALRAALLVQLGSTVLAMLAYLVATRRLAPYLSLVPTLHRPSLAVLASFAVYQLLGQIFGTLSAYADRLILAAWLTPADVTWYHVPAGLAQKVHVLVAAAAAFVFPRMAELSSRRDEAGIARLYGQGVRLTLLGGVAVGVPLAVGGEAFLTGWMGQAFAAQAATSLQLTAVAYTLYCATVMPVLTLLGLGRSRAVALASLLVGGSNVLLALVLVPLLGRPGAGLALCLSMALSLGPLLWVHRLVGASGSELAAASLRLAAVALVGGAATWAMERLLPAHLIAALAALGAGLLAGVGTYFALPGAPSADVALLRRRLGGSPNGA